MSQEEVVCNPYIFELEKRLARKHRLCHEYGSGSRCRLCGDKCIGLDLHYWRKVCKNCKCKAECHDIPDEEDPGSVRIGSIFESPITTRLEQALAANTHSDVHSQQSESHHNYVWTPRGLPASKIGEFMRAMPEENRPIANTPGAQKRREAIQEQLPLHDFEAAVCDSLSAPEAEAQELYVSQLQQVVGCGVVSEPHLVERVLVTEPSLLCDSSIFFAKDESANLQSEKRVRWKCLKCKLDMVGGEMAVFAERVGIDVCWHPRCFVCATCNQPLADLIYFYKKENGTMYCGRHYGESFYPRCAGCDELIFSPEYTVAEGKDWHVKHFCCINCDRTLGGNRYMFKEDAPYCLDCYTVKYAKQCNSCKLKIQADVPRITHNNFNWHANEKCFCCHTCRKSLLSSRYIVRPEGTTFCSSECKNKWKTSQANVPANSN